MMMTSIYTDITLRVIDGPLVGRLDDLSHY